MRGRYGAAVSTVAPLLEGIAPVFLPSIDDDRRSGEGREQLGVITRLQRPQKRRDRWRKVGKRHASASDQTWARLSEAVPSIRCPAAGRAVRGHHPKSLVEPTFPAGAK